MKTVSATLNAPSLLAELRFVAKACEKRSTIPVLRNVLIELEPTTLALAATNLDVTARAQCPVVSDGSTKVTAPAELLVRALSNLIGEDEHADVSLRIIDDDTYSVELEYGGTTQRVFGLPVSEYPTLPTVPAELPGRLPTVDLLAAIRHTSCAIPHKERQQFELNGVQLNVNGRTVEAVASDGHRLAISTFTTHAKNLDGEHLLPRLALELLLSIKGDDLQFGESERHQHYRSVDRCITARTIEVNFPNYREVIAGDLDRQAIIDAHWMTLALRRVMPFTNPRIAAVSLNFSQDTLRIDASDPEQGKASSSIAIEYSGPEMYVGLRSTYLHDFFAQLTGDVQINMKDENSQVILRPVDGGEYLYVVMPVRLGRG